MGVDIFFVSKTKGDSQLYESLSRDFCNFVCGPDAYGDDCEFHQIESLLDIDLSILTRFAPILPPTEDLEYEIYCAEDDGDLAEVEKLNKKLEDFKVDWEKNYPLNNRDWTNVNELADVVKDFQNRLNQNPFYFEKINYNYDWGNYFDQSPMNEWSSKLHADLELLLKYIDEAKSLGENYVTFHFG